MKNKFYGLLIMLLIITAATLYFIPPKQAKAPDLGKNAEPVEGSQDYSQEIQVTSPKLNEHITSPVKIAGRARGFWFFEASMPVSMYDADDRQLVSAPLQAQGEWMTENFVPFDVELAFPTPDTDTGYILFHNDNPSGLPENDKSIKVPIRFR